MPDDVGMSGQPDGVRARAAHAYRTALLGFLLVTAVAVLSLTAAEHLTRRWPFVALLVAGVAGTAWGLIGWLRHR